MNSMATGMGHRMRAPYYSSIFIVHILEFAV